MREVLVKRRLVDSTNPFTPSAARPQKSSVMMCKQRTSLIHDETVATTNFGRIVTVAPHDATRNSSTIVFEGRNSRTENSSVRFDERFALRTGEGKHAMPGRKLDLEEYVINRFCFDFSSKKQGKDSSVHTPLLETTVSNVTPLPPRNVS